MGNLGLPELIFIFVLALLVFGPKRLPELGRTLGKTLSEFKRATNGLKESIEHEFARADRGISETSAQIKRGRQYRRWP